MLPGCPSDDTIFISPFGDMKIVSSEKVRCQGELFCPSFSRDGRVHSSSWEARSCVQEAIHSDGRLLRIGVPGSHVVGREGRVDFGLPVENAEAADTLHTSYVGFEIRFCTRGTIPPTTELDLHHWLAIAGLVGVDVRDDPRNR